MSKRTASWIAWSLGALWLALFAATIAMSILTRSVQPPSTWGTSDPVSNLLIFMPFLAFPIVGTLIASRRPNNPIGWICLASGIFYVLLFLTLPYGLYGLVVNPGSVPLAAQIGALTEWLWAPAAGLLGIYLPLLFPDGRLLSRRWRPLVWLSGAVIVLLSVGIVLAPGPLNGLRGVQNPFGLEQYPWVTDAFLVVVPLLPLCVLASAISLVLRYLHSRGEVREQIKWIAFAALVLGTLGLVDISASLLLVPKSTSGAEPPWLRLLDQVVFLSYTGVPIAVGFAVLKYRLYDIDLIINRTLVYGSLTAILAALYFRGIVVLQRVFVALTGQKSTLAVVASTLVIAALFSPLRRRIQSFIDRRFYRKKYDARKTLEAFSAKLRDETDLDALNDDLVGVVWETMRPTHVSLWLRPELSSGRSEGQE